ncbi:phage antirepressor KilAC domain-containing protein [Clostridium sp. UBA2485]|uniref:phage antirepressor KilAC domain-containing protein n=1 Tax=Clostridium sp. UBA2485 TaxID=1946352 RepID=UPI0025BE6B1A|nr:phage antirepressor KilAC domain-containing protein [Clostridium sp. UBA2485]
MSDLQIFNNPEFGDIRVLEKYGQPWFVAKDIGERLGYSETSVMLRRLDEDEMLKIEPTEIVGANSMAREMTIINESGLYNAVLGSKLPQAKKFKKWVTSEVLPSIRKHGMYAKDELLDNPDLLIEVASRLKQERQARIEAEKKVKALKPKADFYDDVAGSKDAIEMADVAKVLGIKGLGRNKLFDLLRQRKILQPNNIPYQQFVDREYFRVVEQKYTTNKGETKINIKTLVFQKGVDYIRKLAKEA